MATATSSPAATTAPSPPPAAGSRWRAALAGVLAAGSALAAGELVAGLVPRGRSPVVVVGDGVIDLVPGPVKDLAIALFGTADKVALIVGILALVAAFAAVVGIVALRHPRRGVAGIAALGLLGTVAAVANARGAPVAAAVPSLAAALVGVGALLVLVRPLRRPTPAPAASAPAAPATARTGGIDRRGFLRASGAVTGLAVVAVAGGRWLQERASVAASRAALALRPPDVALPPTPPGATVDVPGMPPFVTPNADFYRIDTALQVPQIAADTWRMRVVGMVDRPLELSFADLLDRELVEVAVTIACVSNEVGGGLVGNARWLGVRLADVLEEAGVDPAADQVVGRSVDGFTAGFPVAAALDGRDALIAVGMNGEPLPVEHGFPARLVVPGLYGYVSATKWLESIELTTFDAFEGYWVPRGWAAEGPIKTQSRIDVPRPDGGPVPAGRAAVAGVAWAPTRGISLVEVQVDDGPWQEARLGEVLTEDTWRQWVLEWDATPGPHQIRVRATDGDGRTQPEERTRPAPDGAQGWHTLQVQVTGPA